LQPLWNESIIVAIHKKGNKTDCSNYQGISLLSTAYKILSNILLARLTPHVNEVTGDHQCGFHHTRSTMNQIFYIWQILEKKWEYNEMMHLLFIDFKNAYDSVKREVLYNILLEFGIPKKLVRLIKMCLNETYSKVRVGNESKYVAKFKYLETTLTNQNDIHDEIKSRLNSENAYYYSVQNLLSSHLISKLCHSVTG
jgi:hypothetical protein